MEDNKEFEATVHHFGKAVELPSLNPTEKEIWAADKVLKHTFDEMLAHLPDKVFTEQITIYDAPTVDRLQRQKVRIVSMHLTSPIFDYWNRIAKNREEKAGDSAKRITTWRIRKNLLQEINKSWFTKLCWKLGGFTLPSGSDDE